MKLSVQSLARKLSLPSPKRSWSGSKKDGSGKRSLSRSEAPSFASASSSSSDDTLARSSTPRKHLISYNEPSSEENHDKQPTQLCRLWVDIIRGEAGMQMIAKLPGNFSIPEDSLANCLGISSKNPEALTASPLTGLRAFQPSGPTCIWGGGNCTSIACMLVR
ncbi:putative calcium-binding protein CML35 [Panicum miliaceum]|uniref:Calcium-binding protein CML35 n=1 Tax=Panicum miliaceum TaxID=4540 RepID=A0A3L6PMW2_PANMI|nr:putative calcium-binding protein CML35 [Panicum miliaceum]